MSKNKIKTLCMDCKALGINAEGLWCRKFSMWVDEDDFCSFGSYFDRLGKIQNENPEAKRGDSDEV